MSIEKNETNEEFLNQAFVSLSDFINQEKKADIKDAIEEVCAHLKNLVPTGEGILLDKDAEIIPANKVMNKDAEGKTLCYFGDQSWILIDQKTLETIPVNFGRNHTSRIFLDYTAESSKAYRCLERLATYAVWPKIDKSKKLLAAKTVRLHVLYINFFMDWMSKKNLMRSEDLEISPPDANLVTPSALKEEIKQRMIDGEGTSRVLNFIYGLSMWCNLGKQTYCPDWLRPTFGYRDVLDSEFLKQITAYVVAKTSRWKAIDRDILESMFLTAKQYIDICSEDIFWLEQKFSQGVMRHKKDGKK